MKTIVKYKILCAYETEVTVYQDEGSSSAEATVELPFGTCQISLETSNDPSLLTDSKRADQLGRVGFGALLHALCDGVDAQNKAHQPVAPVVPLRIAETPPIAEVEKLTHLGDSPKVS